VGDDIKYYPAVKNLSEGKIHRVFGHILEEGYILSKKSIRKGYRLEHELEEKLKELGFDAQRVPLSGQSGGLFSGDLIIDGKIAEVKGRGDGFKNLYRWLEGKDLLFVRADRKEWLVIQRLKDWKK
jgi:Holliday junction resolvase